MKLSIKHYTQPNGISCGPTCIMMAYEALPTNLKRKHLSIVEIANLCGTDAIVGTPPERLEKGMKALEMHYTHYPSIIENPFDILKTTIDKGNLPILRTFTHGVPHWIIANGYDNDTFSINDPWQGEISYSKDELDIIWSGRNYEFYEVQMLEIKRGVTPEQLEEIIEWSYPYFKHIIPKTHFDSVLREETNLHSSALLLDKNNKILGTYLIGDNQLSNSEYSKLIGVEGVLLAVDESVRGQGWGEKLKDYPKTLGVDYIWGYQAVGLNNINHWLKRRVLVGRTATVYVTAEKFNK